MTSIPKRLFTKFYEFGTEGLPTNVVRPIVEIKQLSLDPIYTDPIDSDEDLYDFVDSLEDNTPPASLSWQDSYWEMIGDGLEDLPPLAQQNLKVWWDALLQEVV